MKEFKEGDIVCNRFHPSYVYTVIAVYDDHFEFKSHRNGTIYKEDLGRLKYRKLTKLEGALQ